MSKTIKQRKKELQSREQKLRTQLESSGDDLKGKARNIGKIALISGAVALAGYWLYRSFFAEEEKVQGEEEEKEKPKKKKKQSEGIAGRITAFALPFIVEFLYDLLEIRDLREAKKEEKNEDSED